VIDNGGDDIVIQRRRAYAVRFRDTLGKLLLLDFEALDGRFSSNDVCGDARVFVLPREDLVARWYPERSRRVSSTLNSDSTEVPT
jgi:hypothetical protein